MSLEHHILFQDYNMWPHVFRDNHILWHITLCDGLRNVTVTLCDGHIVWKSCSVTSWGTVILFYLFCYISLFNHTLCSCIAFGCLQMLKMSNAWQCMTSVIGHIQGTVDTSSADSATIFHAIPAVLTLKRPIMRFEPWFFYIRSNAIKIQNTGYKIF
jgi:hypothetical protein